MFSHITVHLNGPICDCSENRLDWCIEKRSGKLQLVIHCKRCDTSLKVDTRELEAELKLAVPYSGKKEGGREGNIRYRDDERKIIEFPSKEMRENRAKKRDKPRH